MFRSMFSTFGRVVVILLAAAAVVGAVYALSPSAASATQIVVRGGQAFGNALSSGAVHAVNFSVRGFDGSGDDAGRGGALAGVFTVVKNVLILGFIILTVWLFKEVRQPRRVAAVRDGPGA